jgi:hypothetical protein
VSMRALMRAPVLSSYTHEMESLQSEVRETAVSTREDQVEEAKESSRTSWRRTSCRCAKEDANGSALPS